MIGSTLGQIATADKLSVEQLQQSIQNGTIPAYIGIPLLQEKIANSKRAQMSQAQPPDSPPIAQQVMQEAASVAAPQIPMYQESGVSALPSNLPVTGMRDGGIVSFAEDEEEDESTIADREEAEYLSALQNMTAMANEIGIMGSSPSKEFVPRLNTTPDVEKGMFAQPQQPQQMPQQPQQPQQQPVAGMQQPEGIAPLIQDAASRYKLPEDLMMNLASAESSGRPDAKNPRSTAKGVYQFIDSTWEQMGGTPGNQYDPKENIELGARFIRQNAETLKRSLGRDPSYGEVYAAHYFGPGVAKMLAGASPDTPITEGLGMFNSPMGVDRIIKANPNLQGKTVGEVLSSLEGKAGSGIVSLAKGGAVRFNVGGFNVEPEDPSLITPPAMPPATPPQSGYQRWLSAIGMEPNQGPGAYQPEEGSSLMDYITSQSMSPEASQEIFQPQAPKQKPEPIPVPEAPPVRKLDITEEAPPEKKAPPKTEEKAKTLYDEFLEDYRNSKSDRERQKKMDAYMALATAGFAMAGGASPNAVQNIAQGAIAGMGQYAASDRARRAGEREDTKALLTAQRYQELGEAARATQAMNEARYTEVERQRLGAELQKMIDSVAARVPGGALNAAAYAAEMDRLQKDPRYVAVYNQYMSLSPQAPSPGATQPNTQGMSIVAKRPG